MKNWTRFSTGRKPISKIIERPDFPAFPYLKEQEHENAFSDMDTRILLEVKPDLRPVFLGLLGVGFFIDVKTGCSMKEFLSDYLGLDPLYIEDRIQTIFLDGKAVDNIDSSVIKNGSSIALSAAMPGLVGATLRRKSHYASMRRQLSQADEPVVGSGTKGRVTVKLFNLIAKELGNELLGHGIRIHRDDFKRFIDTLDENHVGAIKAAQQNGKMIDQNKLATADLGGEIIFLQVRSD